MRFRGVAHKRGQCRTMQGFVDRGICSSAALTPLTFQDFSFQQGSLINQSSAFVSKATGSKLKPDHAPEHIARVDRLSGAIEAVVLVDARRRAVKMGQDIDGECIGAHRRAEAIAAVGKPP